MMVVKYKAMCEKTLEGHIKWVWSVCFSPDGKRLASGGQDGTIKVWDVERGECERTIEPNTNVTTVFCVVFSPDGRSVAFASSDVQLWNVVSGEWGKDLL